MNWQRLQEVHDLARRVATNYALYYYDGSDSWCIEIWSDVPSECYVGTEHSFDIAVDCVLEHLRRIAP